MGDVRIHPSANIHPSVRISVTERLVIEEDATIAANCIIEGRDIHIGRELWMDEGAIIGGGSCYERESSLLAGHFLHMGRGSFINTARPVMIGHEVGIGKSTSLFTHGAYLSALQGFPVSFAPISIGDRVWLPGATIIPGVTIGSDVVVGVGSVVTHSIPSGALAAGVPAKVSLPHAYPRPLMGEALRQFWVDFLRHFDFECSVGTGYVSTGDTFFFTEKQTIVGPVTDNTEKLRDQLRRYGIRFWASPLDGEYQPWS